MSTYSIKDSDGSVKYFGSEGAGTLADPFFPTPSNFFAEVSKGNVAGHSIIHKFGRNGAVPNGTFEGILQAGANFNFVTAAATVRVKSGGNANDTAAGTGAQAVTVEGLDDTGAAASEVIELAGASASAVTTTLFWRVNRMYITPLRAGAYGGSNTADIMLENGTGGTDLITILAGEGQSMHAAYSIPLGKTGYITTIHLQSDSNKASDFRLKTRNSLTDFTTPFAPILTKGYWDGVQGSDRFHPSAPTNVLTALTDVWFEAEGSGAISEVSVDFEILLVDD